MTGKIWRMSGAAVAVLLVALSGGWADDAKPSDEGNATEFKGKTFEMKDKSEVAILLTFPAGKEALATTNGTKETDVHLFIYDADNKEIGKDTSPGPKCEIKFTPAKAGKYKLVVKNSKGDNKVTLEVKVAK
jgi:hypothetical protein